MASNLIIKMKKNFRCFIISSLFACLLPSRVFGIFSYDEIQANGFDAKFSPNWYAMVRATVPERYLKKRDFDFQMATNVLCKESKRRNLMAEALWGFTLIVLSDSPKSSQDGLKLMQTAATNGCVAAMMNLGYLFENGKYIKRDYDQAFQWFGRATALNDANGELQLGGCYHYGLGTTPDFAMAVKYYRLSAEQTNYVAMKSLGYVLMNGYGVEKNEAEAKYWLLRGAKEGGSRRAMYNLGVLYCEAFPTRMRCQRLSNG
jgi:TPR repeat protein